MISCNVCYEWRPTNYRVWRYIDDDAYCCFKECNTNRIETCEHGSIVKPGGSDVKQYIGKPVREKPVCNDSCNFDYSELINELDTGNNQSMYAHQLEAIEQYKNSNVIPLFFECGLGKTATVLKIVEHKFKHGEINALLVVAPNQVHCVHKDTRVTFKYNQGDRYNYLVTTIEDLYSRYNNTFEPLFIKSFNGEHLMYSLIEDVTHIGMRECLEIKTHTGKTLICTSDHRILTPNGYVEAGLLQINDMVLCNGETVTCPICGTDKAIIGYRHSKGKTYRQKWTGYCKSCAYSLAHHTRSKDVIGRCCVCGNEAILYGDDTCMHCIRLLRIPNREYLSKHRDYLICVGAQTIGHTRRPGIRSPGVWKHIMVMEESLGRRLLPGEHVHHIDGNTLNNDISNLCLVTPQEHHKLHTNEKGQYSSLQRAYSDNIVSIENVGMQDVYDISVKDTHNFIANSIIVHNCQWAKQEIPKWLEISYDLQIIGGVGGQKVTRPFDTDPQMLQIVCTNVDTFSTKDKWKEIVEWVLYNKSFVVIDEATSIKNYNALRTQRLLYSFNKVIKRGKTILSSQPLTVARAVLTGTPVTNGPMDLWSIMEFVQPNFFGRNWYSFQSYYGMFTSLNVANRVIKVPLTEETWTSIKKILSYGEANCIFGISEDTFNTIHSQERYEGPYKHADELKEKLMQVATFKKLTDCVDMPEQNYIVKELVMSPELKECYDQMADEYIAIYKEHTMTALNKLTVLIRLQQLSSGFMLSAPTTIECANPQDHVAELFNLLDTHDVMPDEVIWIGKTNPKLELLYNDVAEISKPLIIITRFTAEASRIYDDLKDKYKTCLFTGWKKIGSVQGFQAGEYEVMVANIAVVARGFNLQNANTILFYSNTYSLELRLQAEGRIYRIGQKNTCRYMDYSYKNSIDEKITAALLMKRNLLEFLQQADIEDILEQVRVE
jgi:hypothetical protein